MKDSHPEVLEVEVGEKTYKVKLGPAAFRIAQLKHGVEFSYSDLQSPTPATLARLAYVGCLVDQPKLKEIDFLLAMAQSDEGAILRTTMKALSRMSEGLSAATGDSSGNGKPGE